jgi:4-amino-4-deoxy-L-arabinose transferase-like glycosyltransferase
MKKFIDWPFWRSTWFGTGAILAVSLGWKAFLIVRDVIPFNGDEAVVALMARHILQGHWPVFMYGQAYMGSLDAGLLALAFALFGQQVWAIRLVQVILYAAILVTSVFLGREAFGNWRRGLLAALVLAIPTVNVTLYTTATQGGYGETLLIGNLLFLLALKIRRKADLTRLGLWGFLAGLGFWADGMTLVFSVPAFIYLVWSLGLKKKAPPYNLTRLWAALAGGLVGLLPVWIYVAQNGIQQLVMDLTGSAMSVEKASWLGRVGLHLINLVLLGLPAAWGLRPPWTVEWLALPLLPFALIFWIAVTIFFVRKVIQKGEERAIYCLLAGVPACITLGFLFTSFGVDPTGRYFVPLAVPLGMAAVGLAVSQARWGRLRWGLLVLLVVYQILGNIQVAAEYPPGYTTQIDKETIVDHRYDSSLIEFLRQNGEYRGYANYWVAYPLAFLSGEELIYIPRLPYHPDLRYTARDDRYHPYDDLVEGSPTTAYISTARTPALDEKLRAGFTNLGVSWSEKAIGDYRVFYHLSRAVRPQELGLGETTSE